MNIKIHRDIEVPDKMICHHGRRKCCALTKEDGTSNENMRLCSHFNQYVFWSDKAGFYVRCDACIHAQLDYLREA